MVQLKVSEKSGEDQGKHIFPQTDRPANDRESLGLMTPAQSIFDRYAR